MYLFKYVSESFHCCHKLCIPAPDHKGLGALLASDIGVDKASYEVFLPIRYRYVAFPQELQKRPKAREYPWFPRYVAPFVKMNLEGTVSHGPCICSRFPTIAAAINRCHGKPLFGLPYCHGAKQLLQLL